MDNKIYCVSDYHAIFAPICAACGKSITPIEVRSNVKQHINLIVIVKVFCQVLIDYLDLKFGNGFFFVFTGNGGDSSSGVNGQRFPCRLLLVSSKLLILTVIYPFRQLRFYLCSNVM